MLLGKPSHIYELLNKQAINSNWWYVQQQKFSLAFNTKHAQYCTAFNTIEVGLDLYGKRVFDCKHISEVLLRFSCILMIC